MPPEPLIFRAQGLGRFAEAAFLAFWLLGWLVGEVVALGVLGHGLLALLRGAPQPAGAAALPIGAAAAIGGFLLLWLGLWTLGGIAALHQLLLCLWAQDRLSLEGECLVRRRRLGPFRSRRSWPREQIHRIHVRDGGSGGRPLMAQLARGSVCLTDLGTPAERQEAAVLLRRWLQLPETDPLAGTATPRIEPPAELPDGWQCLQPPFGSPLLVPDLRRRRRQASVTGIVTLAVLTLALLLLRQAGDQPSLLPLAAMVATAALLTGWGTGWLALGRKEWRIEARRLVLQERFADRVRERAQAAALELLESRDSDGDAWYDLRAIDLGDPTAGLTVAGQRRAGGHLTITRSLHDPTAPRSLGLWLAQRSGVPFHDRVPTPAQRAAEREQMLQQLSRSGRIGAWLAKRIERGEAGGAGGARRG